MRSFNLKRTRDRTRVLVGFETLEPRTLLAGDAATDGPFRISEILTANASSLETRVRGDSTAAFSGEKDRHDWIEVRNVTAAPVSIGGYHLTDDPDEPSKWRFPAGTTIPASGLLVVFASKLNITDPTLDEQGMLHTNFTLRVEGEYLAIASPAGAVIDEFNTYPAQVPDVTYGRTTSNQLGYLTTATPGQSNSSAHAGVVAEPSVNVGHGIYSQPIQVSLSSETPGAAIRFTTDGSTPTTTKGQIYAGPITVSTTTNLRAAFKDGYVASSVATRTYVFIADVIRQGNSPAGYPNTWGTGKPADYEMDAEITDNAKYRDIIDDALLALPTVSIVTDVDNLFDPQSGIYMNTELHGGEWERPASIELFYPDGRPGFQIDAGLRIQGGASREPFKSPKHGFRLMFRGIYGAEKLAYDWFGGDAVDEFDQIVLRAGFNHSFIHHNTFLGDNRGRAQYIHDQWLKDSFLAMGRAASHNNYAHLYVNGMYWGLYNPSERPTAAFAAAYLGGEKEQYDVLNAGEVLDGNNTAWNQLNSAARNLDVPANYQAFSELLDIDSFVDYMILNHYAGNMDWDNHNWYAVHNREPGGKFYFVPWDSELIFISKTDNRVRIADAAPGRILRALQLNGEFKVLLADRIQHHLLDGGLLTPEKVVERWDVRSNQIFDAIVAESARWGDYRRDVDKSGVPLLLLERDVQWMAERNRLLTDYFPNRTTIVLDQYRRAKMIPTIDAPTFNQHGGSISSGFEVTLSAAAGSVYYTADGSDPRLPGGQVNPNAIPYAGPFKLDRPASVKTRALNDTEWSALNEASFAVDAVPADATNLRISEINYNPGRPSTAETAAGHTDNDDFEFIELVNISNRRIDLSGIWLERINVGGGDVGVAFDFSDGALKLLEPGQRVLVVEDSEAFQFRYGKQLPVAGQWTGGLDNASDWIRLTSSGQVIHEFYISDKWQPATDGAGFTLEVIDPLATDIASWKTKEAWRASRKVNGTPGTSSDALVPGDSNHDGIFNSSDLVLIFQVGEYEDLVAGNSTFEDGDWNGDGEFTTADLVFAFQAGSFIDT